MSRPAPVEPGAGRAQGALGLPAAEIEATSLARLRATAPGALPPPPADAVALRLAYAAGDPSLLADVVVDGDAVPRARRALHARRPLLVDTHMLLAGIQTTAQRWAVEAWCALDASTMPLPDPLPPWAHPGTAAAATTRSARGLVATLVTTPGSAEAGRAGATGPVGVVATGTAPSALLALLDLLADGMPPPEVVVATCCGLVAAAEAKELLLELRRRLRVAVVVVRGPRGGAAVAAAAINALGAAAAS